MSKRRLVVPGLLLAIVLGASAALAAPVDRKSADRVAANWVALLCRDRAAWAGAEPIATYYDLLFSDGEPRAYLYSVQPAGYVMVPIRDELSPVTAYSTTTVLAVRTPGGFFDLVRDDLGGRLSVLTAKQDTEPVSRHASWKLLDREPVRFAQELAARTQDEPGGVGPLLTTVWQQGWPFNTLCPEGAGGRTYVGCTALATAQILYHHGWPLHGVGERSYWWPGDEACGGSTGLTLGASFVEPYDWSLMTPVVDWLSPVETQAAVAELCYDVAVACQTDFSFCGSAASLDKALNALITHFRFRDTAREQMRFRFSDDTWFALLCDEVSAGRPVLYSTLLHTMVVDGWRDDADLRQVHVNYGWAGESDDWYTLETIETAYNPQTERMVIGLEPGATANEEASWGGVKSWFR